MAIFRIDENNNAYLVKSVRKEDEDLFIRVNSRGKLKYIKVEKFPPCKFETWKYNPNTKEIEIDKERFTIKARKVFSEKLKNLEFQRLQQILNKYGYKDLGDVQYWYMQNPNDLEPKGLLDWYVLYDDTIWKEINNLQNRTYDSLKNYDPIIVENQIFELTKDKLPPMEKE